MMWGAMFARPPSLSSELERPDVRDAWIAWARVFAAPLVFLEVLVERGNYPSGDEALAWTAAGILAAGSLLFLRFPWWRAAALTFDWAVVSGFVVLYSFEPGTPVTQLLLLPVVEAALRYRVRGGLLMPLASLPALAFFEWRQAVRLDLHPFDPGHVVGPVGIQLLVGLALGALLRRAAPEDPRSGPPGANRAESSRPSRSAEG
jgi:hypothetical protein